MILDNKLCLGSDPGFTCGKSSDTCDQGAFKFNNSYSGQMTSCIGMMTSTIQSTNVPIEYLYAAAQASEREVDPSEGGATKPCYSSPTQTSQKNHRILRPLQICSSLPHCTSHITHHTSHIITKETGHHNNPDGDAAAVQSHPWQRTLVIL